MRMIGSLVFTIMSLLSFRRSCGRLSIQTTCLIRSALFSPRDFVFTSWALVKGRSLHDQNDYVHPDLLLTYKLFLS